MSSELVMRMRTCAAALARRERPEALLDPSISEMMLSDAADLLAEASNLLDVEEPLGEVMEALEPAATGVYRPGATWISGRPAELPAAVPRPCPACGNVAARRVRITNTKLLLTCPMCLHEWEYVP